MSKIVNLNSLKLSIFGKTINESDNNLMNKYIKLLNEYEVLKYTNYIFDNILDLNNKVTDDFINENLGYLDKFSKTEIYESNKILSDFITINDGYRKSSDILTKIIELYVEGVSPVNLVTFKNLKLELINEISCECELNKEKEEENLDEVVTIEEIGGDIDSDLINEYVLKYYKEKYSNVLDEKQINIINTLFLEGDDNKKSIVFNDFKKDILQRINEMVDVDDDIKKEVAERINEIKYNPATLIESFIILNDLIS